MPRVATALIAPSAGAAFEVGSIERREVGPRDVEIDIAFVGICHTDLHQVAEDWGPATFPMVPGHEITGVVAQVGSDVSRYKVGDRVGVGCFVDSCRKCASCLDGNEQYCERGAVYTYNSNDYDGATTYGGYSSSIVVDEAYTLRIPGGLDLAAAAPLLCAGITLFSPLKHWRVGPESRIGIIGMGGLGHVGVKIAAAMGAEVTVLSRTLDKKADGLRFGATNYVATSDPDTAARFGRSLDLILSTVSANQHLDALLGLLRLDGALVYLGIPDNAESFTATSLIGARRTISGSSNGSIQDTQEMLDFCAEHNIGAEIETVNAADIQEAFTRLARGDVRYRFVIDASTITSDKADNWSATRRHDAG